MVHHMDDNANHPSKDRAKGGGWWITGTCGAALTGWLIFYSLTAKPHGASHDPAPALWSVIPFVGLLLCIALLPLIQATAHWWESNRNRLLISLCFSAFTVAYYLLAYDGTKVLSVLEHAVTAEYIPFMVLLFSLYVISGGISLKGDLAAHPALSGIVCDSGVGSVPSCERRT